MCLSWACTHELDCWPVRRKINHWQDRNPKMCSSKKNPTPPPPMEGHWKFLAGGGLTNKNFRGNVGAKMEFPEEGGGGHWWHYEIAPIETHRPIKVGYHEAFRALQSVPLLAISFVSQHESSRVFNYLFAREEGVYVRKVQNGSSALWKEHIKVLT